MRRAQSVLVVMCFAAAACRSVKTPAPRQLEAPVQARSVAEIRQDYVTGRIHRAADLLGNARTAAVSGDATEFADCEAVLMEMVAEDRDLIASSPELASLAADTIHEMARLSAAMTPAEEDEGEDEEVASDAVPAEIEPAADARVAAVQKAMVPGLFDLPVIVNADVTSLIDFYTGRYRERFGQALGRSTDYIEFIREELRQAEMPEDLAYLPLIERGFLASVRSRARAQVMWQFMKGTAKLYELRVDSIIDERNDPYLATRAAIRHLEDLHDMFGSWELVLAAYNSGAGRVQRAIARSKNGSDYWSIRKNLPRETRNYVPAMWAALIVAKNPEAFSFPRLASTPLCLDRVRIEGAVDLDVLAQSTGIPADLLQGLNPALLRRLTPADGKYELAVPFGFAVCVRDTVAAIPVEERVRKLLHVVVRGDTPAKIARRYGSSVDALMAANGARALRSLKVGDTVTVPRLGMPSREQSPRRATAQSNAAAKPQRRAGTQAAPGAPTDKAGRRYVVRQGDTLYDIARRFGLSSKDLQRRNGMTSSRIHPGDVLAVD
jgi:membrane-bound lytic murein transglycosylase D